MNCNADLYVFVGDNITEKINTVTLTREWLLEHFIPTYSGFCVVEAKYISGIFRSPVIKEYPGQLCLEGTDYDTVALYEPLKRVRRKEDSYATDMVVIECTSNGGVTLLLITSVIFTAERYSIGEGCSQILLQFSANSIDKYYL